MAKEYTADLQKLFLEMMMNDAQNYVRVSRTFTIQKTLTPSLKDTAEFIKKHSDEHGALAIPYEQIQAVTGVELKPAQTLQTASMIGSLEEFEGFTKRFLNWNVISRRQTCWRKAHMILLKN